MPIYNLQCATKKISLTDPAISAMTDLKYVNPVTIAPDCSIELALEVMRYAGVRMLLVVSKDEQIIGLVTARDLMGEKPLKIIEQERIKHNDILVQRVMTPRDDLNPFDIRDIEHASIKDVILKLKDAGRQHAIVLEQNADQKGYFARGIFSITQIGRQLGMEISPDGHVQSFSEFEKLIAEDAGNTVQYHY